jgi:hypothetical protein
VKKIKPILAERKSRKERMGIILHQKYCRSHYISFN